MKTAVTLSHHNSDWGNICTVILTGNKDEDEKLMLDACECMFNGKAELSQPIEWEHIGKKPYMNVFIIVTEENEEPYELIVVVEVTTIFEKVAKPIYLLFGGEAVDTYDTDGIDELIEGITLDRFLCSAYAYNPAESHPTDLLSEFEGWNQWVVIEHEEYVRIEKSLRK